MADSQYDMDNQTIFSEDIIYNTEHNDNRKFESEVHLMNMALNSEMLEVLSQDEISFRSVKTQTDDVMLDEIRHRLNIIENKLKQWKLKKRKKNVATQTEKNSTSIEQYIKTVRTQMDIEALETEKNFLYKKIDTVKRQIEFLNDFN